MHSVQLIRDQSENPSDLAQDISQDMILLATTVKNAEFLMFRVIFFFFYFWIYYYYYFERENNN